MGITIDKEEATDKFNKALTLALSDTPLPEEWLERTKEIGKAKNKTFTPVLGTALLAKATNRFVDAFSLREGESHKSYSARSLAKDILVPCCVRAGIDIRNKGAEPLNNQPFLRAPRISTDLNVKPNAVAELEYLCQCLERADFLEDRTALEALAAFLRLRISESKKGPSIELGTSTLSFPDLCTSLDEFLAGENEGGKVGQAVVTALLDLAFENVQTKKINDPSNKWPGDVGVFSNEAQTYGVEVKQRSMTEAEVLLFAGRLREAGLHRGAVVALAQHEDEFDPVQLHYQAHRVYNIELAFYFTGSELLEEVARYSVEDIPFVLAEFPRLVIERMTEIECSSARISGWAALFGPPPSGAAPPPTSAAEVQQS